MLWKTVADDGADPRSPPGPGRGLSRRDDMEADVLHDDPVTDLRSPAGSGRRWCEWLKRHGIDPMDVVVPGWIDVDDEARAVRYLGFHRGPDARRLGQFPNGATRGNLE